MCNAWCCLLAVDSADQSRYINTSVDSEPDAGQTSPEPVIPVTENG